MNGPSPFALVGPTSLRHPPNGDSEPNIDMNGPVDMGSSDFVILASRHSEVNGFHENSAIDFDSMVADVTLEDAVHQIKDIMEQNAGLKETVLTSQKMLKELGSRIERYKLDQKSKDARVQSLEDELRHRNEQCRVYVDKLHQEIETLKEEVQMKAELLTEMELLRSGEQAQEKELQSNTADVSKVMQAQLEAELESERSRAQAREKEMLSRVESLCCQLKDLQVRLQEAQARNKDEDEARPKDDKLHNEVQRLMAVNEELRREMNHWRRDSVVPSIPWQQDFKATQPHDSTAGASGNASSAEDGFELVTKVALVTPESLNSLEKLKYQNVALEQEVCRRDAIVKELREALRLKTSEVVEADECSANLRKERELLQTEKCELESNLDKQKCQNVTLHQKVCRLEVVVEELREAVRLKTSEVVDADERSANLRKDCELLQTEKSELESSLDKQEKDLRQKSKLLKDKEMTQQQLEVNIVELQASNRTIMEDLAMLQTAVEERSKEKANLQRQLASQHSAFERAEKRAAAAQQFKDRVDGLVQELEMVRLENDRLRKEQETGASRYDMLALKQSTVEAALIAEREDNVRIKHKLNDRTMKLNEFERNHLTMLEQLGDTQKLRDADAAKVRQMEELHVMIKANEQLLRKREDEIEELRREVGRCRSDSDTQVVLRHQLDIYRVDFEAERNAREQQHAEAERLKAELSHLQERNRKLEEDLEISSYYYMADVRRRHAPGTGPLPPVQRAAAVSGPPVGIEQLHPAPRTLPVQPGGAQPAAEDLRSRQRPGPSPQQPGGTLPQQGPGINFDWREQQLYRNTATESQQAGVTSDPRYSTYFPLVQQQVPQPPRGRLSSYQCPKCDVELPDYDSLEIHVNDCLDN